MIMNKNQILNIMEEAIKLTVADVAEIKSIDAEYNITRKCFECVIRYDTGSITHFIPLGLFTEGSHKEVLNNVIDSLINRHFQKLINQY